MSRIVTFGEIMARLAAPGFKRFQQAMPGSLDVTFAGAEASVAVSIASLGGDATFVTALPDNALADACVAELRGLGVDTRHILRTPHGRLGLYFLETGANQRPGNVIYDREGSSVAITPPEAYDWEQVFQDASWFLVSGITPAISSTASEAALHAVQEASKRGVKVACDMNFRSKLWRWDPTRPPAQLAEDTIKQLMPHMDMFIGGLEDASRMLGIHPANDVADARLDVAKRIVAAYPRVRRVAMSLREGVSASHNNWGGLLYDADSDQLFQAPLKPEGHYAPYKITAMVDRLGGGDAFTAGLLFGLNTPELSQPAQALAFATAAGCLAHSIEGDYNRSTRAEVEALMAGDASGRVNR